MTLLLDYSRKTSEISPISSLDKIPDSIRQIICTSWQHRYEELYEENPTKNITLEETLSNIFDAIEQHNSYSVYLSYIYMSIILALAVKPTIDAYLPNDSRPKQAFQSLSKNLDCLKKSKKHNPSISLTPQIKQLFPHLSEGCQAIDEALDVFKNLLRILDPSQAREALLNILDDCLEGYAIFPESQGRRDLFNWWLLEVVPASWCFQPPEVIYTLKGIKNAIEFLEENLE